MGGVDIAQIVRQGRNDILAGSLAGSACKLVEYPLDTVKVQMQTAGSGTSLSNLGPIGLLRMNVREHGFMRLYQGISSPLVGSMAENATLFVSFNLAQSLCHDGPKETMPVHKMVVCAMASGVAVSTVLTPVELIKCRMQTLASDAVRVVQTVQTLPRGPPLAADLLSLIRQPASGGIQKHARLPAAHCPRRGNRQWSV